MTRNTTAPMDSGTNPPSRSLSELARKNDPLIVGQTSPTTRPVAIVLQPQQSLETGNIAAEVISITPETASP